MSNITTLKKDATALRLNSVSIELIIRLGSHWFNIESACYLPSAVP